MDAGFIPSTSLNGWMADASERLRHRPLQDDAEHVRVVVHGDEPRLALLLCQRARPGLRLETEPHLLRGVLLPADVHGDFLVLADADRHEAADGVGGRRPAHAFRDLVENAVAHCSAVEQAVVLHRDGRSDGVAGGHVH
jgi:hypothetical protein